LSFTSLYKAVLVVFTLTSITACAQIAPPPAPWPAPSPTPTSFKHLVFPPKSTPTPTPFYLTATVWETDPVVPILLYHRFKTNKPSTPNITSRIEFQEELETLYESGYVTIPLEQWLTGDLRVPDGKRPLVLTMDDLFYENQISLTSEGTPSDQTGLGLAWKFSQEHPDFGFHWALFASLGDKPYGMGTQEEQDAQLANVIVWCIEHGAMVYNHTFRHVRLNQTDGLGIIAELKYNDLSLRKFLALANRRDLTSELGNFLAVPAGLWPRSSEALNALYDYENPEGVPLQGIFDVDFITRPNFMKAPYAWKFDRMKLPRMVADLDAIKYLKENKDAIPAAHECMVGPLDKDLTGNASYMGQRILNVVRNGECPTGVYAIENFIFRADATEVELLHKAVEK
jgi:hypothetical protein